MLWTKCASLLLGSRPSEQSVCFMLFNIETEVQKEEHHSQSGACLGSSESSRLDGHAAVNSKNDNMK